MQLGLNSGLTMAPNGDTSEFLATVPLIVHAGAKWVRIGMGGGYQYYRDWTTPGADGTTMQGKFDVLIPKVKQAGLKIMALVDSSMYYGNQAQQTANNQETGKGNGDNPWLQALGQTFSYVSQRYAGSIDAWEVWNEPNAWTIS